MLFADMAPNPSSASPRSSSTGKAAQVVPAEAPADAAAQGPDMTWWEGPLDRIMGRRVDGKTSFMDATTMSLSEVNALAKAR